MNIKNEVYHFSIRCYFGPTNEDVCNHHVQIPVKDLPKWIECYKFTHPNCISISIRTWFDKERED